MNMKFFFIFSALFVLVATAPAKAARPSIDDGDRVATRGAPSPEIVRHPDLGPSDPALPVERATLVLAPRAGASADLSRLLAAQVDPASPDYHRWLTPEEFGRRFGVDDDALAAILDWLQAHGFAVDEVAAGRQWVSFSGTAGSIAEAFAAPMHDFAGEEGVVRHAAVSNPTIPRALAPYVRGVLSLSDFPRKRSALRRRPVPRPDINFMEGDHGLGPADFAVQYHVEPLYDLGIDGAGVSIAVVGRTDIKLADVQAFRSFFGLPANDPNFIHNGADPGDLGSNGTMDGTDEESEADLDVEWTGAVAPGAAIQFVISKSTAATDAADLSAQYAVDHRVAPILSSSFGLCERDLDGGNGFYDALWQQAAAEGITVFVPSGDSGVAGCDDPTAASGTVAAVSGLCSTPYDVCVGGTMLEDFASPATYWLAAENPNTHESLATPVPEIVWNESGAAPSGGGRPAGSNLFASGGGPSTIYPKPDWQVAPGVPGDGKRDTPDVSLNAGSHDGYVVFQNFVPGGSVFVVSGTSASTVAFAGLMALVVQAQGGQGQGNANPVFYRMGAEQFAGGPRAVFRDVTQGNNSVPGLAGFSAQPGYDLATGLGSVDATSLVLSWSIFASPRPGVRPVPSTAPARVHERPAP